MKGMTFDQTERYRGAGLILDTFFRQPERHLRRVLDVGGYFHTLHGEELLPLQKMFPGLDSIVADITPCSLPGYHRLTPGKPLPFDNQEFAVTICMDVLEHVPQDQRESFL
ncbi:hypothetical protein JXA80_00730, partial [bacterium]|nr:hypothetical protein [candidate division CSSED10-310 bacterium]